MSLNYVNLNKSKVMIVISIILAFTIFTMIFTQGILSVNQSSKSHVTIRLRGEGKIVVKDKIVTSNNPEISLEIPYGEELKFQVEIHNDWYLKDIEVNGKPIRIYGMLESPIDKYPPYAEELEGGMYQVTVPIKDNETTITVNIRPISELLQKKPIPVNITYLFLTETTPMKISKMQLKTGDFSWMEFLWEKPIRRLVLRITANNRGSISFDIYAGLWYNVKTGKEEAIYASPAICFPQSGGTVIVEVYVNPDHPMYKISKLSDVYDTLGEIFYCRVLWANAPYILSTSGLVGVVKTDTWSLKDIRIVNMDRYTQIRIKHDVTLIKPNHAVSFIVEILEIE